MCVSPLEGWYAKKRNPKTRKRSVVFDLREGLHDRPVAVPCGRCIECRLQKARSWALRCMHEASFHKFNCWITLTYDDENLPDNGSLSRRDLQLFLKKLRKRHEPERFKFFASGEYGGNTMRPHYHVMLFGLDFADKKRIGTRDNFPVWHSDFLDSVWGKGNTEIGSLTVDSAMYTCKYIVDKDDRVDFGAREMPFLQMSRGGRNGRGIGHSWYKKNQLEMFRDDNVIIKGSEVAIPRYYQSLMAQDDAERLAFLKAKRKAKIDVNEERSSRQLARKRVMESGINARKDVV